MLNLKRVPNYLIGLISFILLLGALDLGDYASAVVLSFAFAIAISEQMYWFNKSIIRTIVVCAILMLASAFLAVSLS